MSELAARSPGLETPPAGTPGDLDGEIHQIGQWALVWRRFRRHRMAVVGGYIALVMLALALLGPLLAPTPASPGLNGETPIALWMHRNQAPQLWPLSHYLMGADAFGNPILDYVLMGGRAVLAISVLGALIASLLGILIGSLAGYLGRAVDAVLMRVVDAALAIPFLLLLILLTRYLTERSVTAYIVLFGLTGWPGVARLVRGYVLSLRRREYAEAARALGVSTPGIILRHLLPNALDVMVVSFTLNVGVFLVTEVTMEYLGAGTDTITWGSVLPAAFGGILSAYWWLAVFPGLAILLTVLAVNFLGDGLRDALDASSHTAAFTASGRVRARAPRQSGPRHALGAVLSRSVGVARGAGHAVRARSVPVRQQVAGALGRAAPSWLHGREVADRAPSRKHGIPVRLGPIAAAFVAVGAVFLAGHSPLAYAPHYAPPVELGTVYSDSEYGGEPLPDGGWNLFVVNGAGRLVYERVTAAGTVQASSVWGSGDNSTRPAMARAGHRVLGAWVADSGQTIDVSYLQAPPGGPAGAQPRTLRLVPPGGVAAHPAVVPVAGGFDVLFDWQRPGTSTIDLEMATLRGTSRPILTRIVASGDAAIYPRGIVDGGGALNLFYLRRTSPGLWHVFRQRFSPAGAPLGRPAALAEISYVLLGPNGCNMSDVAPLQWAIDLKHAPDGSIWAAWEGGNDCVSNTGISGTNTLYLGHWDARGRSLLPPVTIDPVVEAGTQAVALALQGNGGQLYYERIGPVQPYLGAVHFDRTGTVYPAERVSYDGGGDPADPRAGTVAGRPRLIWEKIRADGSILQSTAYRSAQSPDLLTRLGLNLGPLPANLLLVIVGSLGGAGLLTLVNVLLLTPLLPVWLLVRRDGLARVRRPLFLLALAGWLAWVFGTHAAPPGYVLVVSGLSGAAHLTAPYRWLALAGAIFVAGWGDRYVFARQEGALRAAATALTALYFVLTMYLVLFVQVEITRI